MTSPPPRASRYLTFHGHEIVRRLGFLRGTTITCPAGHRIRPDSVVQRGLLFCDHRPERGHAECGALIYALVMPSYGDPLHRVWLADVTREEWRELERLHMDAQDVLDYFGAGFAR